MSLTSMSTPTGVRDSLRGVLSTREKRRTAFRHLKAEVVGAYGKDTVRECRHIITRLAHTGDPAASRRYRRPSDPRDTRTWIS